MRIRLPNPLLCVAALLLCAGLHAQKPTVTITPDRASGHYLGGERVTFTVEVALDGKPMQSGELHYTLRDGVQPFGKGTVVIQNGKGTFSGTRTSPGFLLAKAEGKVDGQSVTGLGGAAFEAEKLQPLLDEPDDFDAFWAKGLAKQAALTGKVELKKIDSYSRKDFTCYLMKVPAVDGGFAYGYLTIPAGKGPFPAVINVPGAGPGHFYPDVTVWGNKGVISLYMNIHAYEPTTGNKSALKKVYADHYPGRTSYLRRNLEDPEAYIYYRGHLVVSAAIDYIASLPQFDGEFIIWGASQGGTYAVAMAALNPHITGAVSAVPGFSDSGGSSLHGRNSRLMNIMAEQPAKRADVLDVSRYFDTAFFARRIKVPVYFMANFIDVTCSPQSVYTAYNQIQAEKSMRDDLNTGHGFTPPMRKDAMEWISKKLQIPYK